MNIGEIIDTLENNSCYECSFGCESPIKCVSPYCNYKVAYIVALDLLKTLAKELKNGFDS